MGQGRACHHVNFGMVSHGGRAMSTRKGRVIYLKDVLLAAVRQGEEIMMEKSPDLPTWTVPQGTWAWARWL
jgi:arginyl-tRNA synthetase